MVRRGGSWPENFTRLERIVHHLDRKAFYSVGADTLVRFGIAGMMSMLDPDTVFMEKMNLDNFRIDVQGEYGGLGFRIQVIRPDSAIAIASLLHEKTPAALAGVRSGTSSSPSTTAPPRTCRRATRRASCGAWPTPR